jgi:RNA polymerase sigma factor (sigma-70 family)
VKSYEAFYVENAPAARRLALSMVPPDVADDIVAEAFTRVLGAIRAGGGPGVTFRGYLLAAVRNLASDWLRAKRRMTVVRDVDAEVGDRAAERSAAISRTSSGAEVQAETRAEARLVARAFARLPARWRAVLWHLEVEGQAPAAVAPLFGLSANGVSALAVRAREGLRQAYLQEHVGVNIPVACRAHRDALGAGARGRLSRRRRVAVDEHLRRCPACTELLSELTELSSRLGTILTPAALAGASAGLTAGRRALSTRAGLAGHWRLWRLHPVAGATAGMAAAGGLVFAVNIMPMTGSPSQHAAVRPAISASGLASPGSTPGRETGPFVSGHGHGKTGSLETAKSGGRIGAVPGAAGSSAQGNRKAAKKAAIAAKKAAKQQAKASKQAAKQAAKASKQAAKANKKAAKASTKAGKKSSKASLTVANTGGTSGGPVLASMRGYLGHHGYPVASPAQPRPSQRTAASSGRARRGTSSAGS